MSGVDALERRPGVLGLVAGTLVRPRTTLLTMGRIKRRWWGIPALLMLVVLIVTVVAYSRADCQYVHRLEMNHYLSSTTQGGRPPEPPTPLLITMAIRAGGRVVSTVVSWLAWSGALYLLLILLGQNDVGFGRVWALVLWSWMPYVVRGLIQSVTMTIAHRPIYNQGLSGLVVDSTPPPPMTFRYVIPTTNQRALASLLERVDVYLVWQLVLLVMGTMALTSLPRRKAIAVICGILVGFTLISLVPEFFPGTFARFRYF